jgi:hypothetical protein
MEQNQGLQRQVQALQTQREAAEADAAQLRTDVEASGSGAMMAERQAVGVSNPSMSPKPFTLEPLTLNP